MYFYIKIPSRMTNLFKLTCFILFIVALSSCKQNSTTLSSDQSVAVKDSVLKLANITAQDVSSRGPIAWLDHFENSPDFFMASDGALVFPNYSAADSFIRTKLTKQFRSVGLKWSGISVYPITSQSATMGANFHEDIATQDGKTASINGYFTAVVVKTGKGWQFRNAHWSTKAG